MPQYKVKSVGFFNNRMYDPEGKRQVLYVDDAFKDVPSWLELMKPETEAQKKRRTANEKKKSQETAERMAQDQKDISNAALLGDGEAGSVIETL